MYFARVLFVLVLFAPAVSWANPDIQHWTLKNGVRVLFVEAHEIPMVRIRMVFDAGSARDEPGKGGEARMTNRMLSEGTATVDGDAVARELDGMGANLENNVDRDMASFGLRSLSKPKLLDPAVKLLGQLVRNPAFPKASLERDRGRALVGLAQQQQSPDAIAYRAFFRTLYGSHPYAHDPSGTMKSIRALTRADLVGFYKRYYVGANAVLVLVGDLNQSQAHHIAKEVAGALPRGEAAPALPAAPALNSAIQRNIVFPSTQTHVLIGAPGDHRGDPDYFPLYVGNHILGGGGLVSRLSQEVREKRGLTYGVYSYFYPLQVNGPFIIGFQTRTKQYQRAMRVTRKILVQYIKQGPTQQDLKSAKERITGGFPLRIDTSGKIADYLSVIGFYHLPLNYLDDFNHNVDAVTVSQIRNAFQRRLNPAHMVTVTVGAKG